MQHKKFFLIILSALIVFSSCCAYAEDVRVGMISQARTTAEDYSRLMADARNFVLWEVGTTKTGLHDEFRFYDNLAAMLLALQAGEINGMFLTRPVAEYLTAQNSNLKISAVIGLPVELGYAFGFMNDEKGKSLCNKFNEALTVIKQVGRLDKLNAKYIVNPGKQEPEIVKFATFQDGDTIRVAVTGDLPPLDYITADGKAAGFNTALLAEIGKHLGCNIEIMQVDSAARVPALTSGRADVVFWFSMWAFKGSFAERQPDLTSDIIVSAPYYTTDLLFKAGNK